MGLSLTALNYIAECAEAAFGGLRGRRMLELGNQLIAEDRIREKSGKEYYLNREVEHVSFDLNGEDGALSVDLSRPIHDAKWHGYFDIITNSGTSEHVGPPKKAQYTCFMNIHKCLKVGGIAVHLVPAVTTFRYKSIWDNHSNYYYSDEFFKMLARSNNYLLVSLTMLDGFVCACLQKIKDESFMENRRKFMKHIKYRGLPQIYAGINDAGIYKFIYILYCIIKPPCRLIKHCYKLISGWRQNVRYLRQG